MIKSEIKELFSLANASKKVGDYNAANIVFAALFAEYQNQDKDTENMITFVETRDVEGREAGESYYDLATIRYINEYQNEFIDVCIPIPLLSVLTVADFYKSAAFMTERHESNRETVAESADKTAARRARITELLGGEYATQYLREMYLARDTDISVESLSKLIADEMQSKNEILCRSAARAAGQAIGIYYPSNL